MSRLLPLAVLAAAAAAIVVWLMADPGAGPARPLGEPDPAASDAEQERPPVDPETSRTAAIDAVDPTPEPREADVDDDSRPAEEPQDADQPAPDAPPSGTVVLDVRRAGSNEPVAPYRVVRVTGLADLPIETRVREGSFRIPKVELGAPSEVLIEADGYVPSDPIDVSLGMLETERTVRVDLVPASRGNGVLLMVRDSDLQPVEHLRIIAWRRPLDAREGLERSRAWTRLAQSTDGGFELPDLELGDYRFELGACDAEGTLRLQQPGFVELEWRGGGRAEHAVDLVAGAGLRLTVTDPATGRVLGNDVALRLEDAAGEHVEMRFGHYTEDKTTVAFDTLPHAGPCSLDAPLPAGRYTLRCQFPNGDQIAREVVLTALRETEVRLP